MEEINAEYLLKVATSGNFNKFLHDCVDELVGFEYNQESVYNNDIENSSDDIRKAKAFIKSLYNDSIMKDSLPDKFKGLSLSNEEDIKKCYEIRKKDIYNSIVKQSLIAANLKVVENIDWKVKWILGSSKLATLVKPVVQVDLHYLGSESEKKKCISFEMELEEVDVFINELEKVEFQ